MADLNAAHDRISGTDSGTLQRLSPTPPRKAKKRLRNDDVNGSIENAIDTCDNRTATTSTTTRSAGSAALSDDFEGAVKKKPGSITPRLQRNFFDTGCVKLAQSLLGQRLVRLLPSGQRLSGVIVETEAYVGSEDKAAHSYKGKKTPRNAAMFMQPGTIYVYNIYGMYTCLNISSAGDGEAVLIRALDPVEGIEEMKTYRGKKKTDLGKGLKIKDLTSGPSKLTQAMDINKADFDQSDIIDSDVLWIEAGDEVDENNVVHSKRIGIDRAEEWVDKLLRFYVLGNRNVSVVDKKAETEMK